MLKQLNIVLQNWCLKASTTLYNAVTKPPSLQANGSSSRLGLIVPSMHVLICDPDEK